MTLLEAALKYCELGMSVIPISNDKKPYIKWKAYQAKRPEPKDIRSWWKKWPEAKVGIVTGKISGIVSLDFDTPDALNAYEATIDDLSGCLRFQTGRGYQYIFKWESYGEGNKAGIMPNVDIRGDGGYIVAPPSIHSNGRVYSWNGNINPLVDGLDELTDMPPDTLSFCKGAPKTQDIKAEGDKKPPAEITPITLSYDATGKPELSGHHIRVNQSIMDALLWGASQGTRNATGAKIVGWLVADYAKQGASKEQMRQPVIDAALSWNQRNQPPLPDADIRTICNSIIERHAFVPLSKAIGSDIYMMEKVIRRARPPMYIIYGTGDKVISCSMEELASLNKFRIKYAEMTDLVIPPIKAADWFKYIQECLQGAIQIVEEIDQSPTFAIGIWVMERARINEGNKMKLATEAVLLDGDIHITMTALHGYINDRFMKNATEFDAKRWLMALGFTWNKNSRLRLNPEKNSKMVRTWKIAYSALETILYPEI
jgi:hypothetical protein